MDPKVESHVKETGWSIRLPLILLAIPSMAIGYLMFDTILAGNSGIFGNTITPYLQAGLGNMSVVTHLAHEADTATPLDFILHSIYTIPFWLAVSAVVLAYLFYVKFPRIPAFLANVKS